MTSNKQRVHRLLDKGVRTVSDLVNRSGLTEEQVLNALRNLQHADNVPLKIRTETVKVVRVIY